MAAAAGWWWCRYPSLSSSVDVWNIYQLQLQAALRIISLYTVKQLSCSCVTGISSPPTTSLKLQCFYTHSHFVIQSFCHTVILSYSHFGILAHSHFVTQPFCFHVTQLLVTMSSYDTVTSAAPPLVAKLFRHIRTLSTECLR